MPRAKRSRATAILTNVLLAVPIVAGLAVAAWIGLSPGRGVSTDQASLRLRPSLALPPVPVQGVPDARPSTLSLAVGDERSVLLLVDPSCLHCHDQVRLLEEMRQRLDGRAPLRVVLVSVGDAEGAAAFRAVGPRFPVYQDTRLSLRKDYGLLSVPVLLVVDEGVVRQVHFGLQPEKRLQQILFPSPA